MKEAEGRARRGEGEQETGDSLFAAMSNWGEGKVTKVRGPEERLPDASYSIRRPWKQMENETFPGRQRQGQLLQRLGCAQ